MGSDFGVVFHVWDFADEPATTLDRVLGEIAPDHLTVPAVTGPVERLRLDSASALHAFISEGGWHFPPNRESYKSGSVSPRSAHWTGKRDVLAKLRVHASSRGAGLVFRVDLRALTSLPEHEPHLRLRNAWGDENPSAGICVLNADARELLRDTFADLLRYEPAGFQLVDWLPDLAINRGRQRQFAWNPLLRQLLDICFCPACRQAADVDPDQAARSVRVHAEHLISGGDEADALERLNADETLREYIDARRRDTFTWLDRLAASHEACKCYLLIAPWSATDHWLNAETALSHLPSGAVTPVLRASSSPLRDLDVQRDFVTPTSQHEIGSFGLVLPVWQPFVQQADELVRTVHAAAEAGVAPIEFTGVEETPGEAIDWIRKAVRYARRS